MGFTVQLTEIQFFLIHSAKFPGSVDPVSHLLACGNWPMVHPNQNHYGKSVEVLCSMNQTWTIHFFWLVPLNHEQLFLMIKSMEKESLQQYH